MRLLVALLVVMTSTSPAVAECIDHKQRPCRLRVTAASAELLRAPDFTELRSVLLRVALSGGGEERSGWEIETARFDMIDRLEYHFHGLGFRYQLDRADFGAWLGVHLLRWNDDSVRFLTPSVGFRIGAEERSVATIELRSGGMYLGAEDDPRGRSLARDLELDARFSTPQSPSKRVALRSRFRSLDAGDVQLRDLVLALGVELSIGRGSYRSAPSFVGVGLRRELARTRERPEADVIERGVFVSEPAPWQVLAWLELDLGLEER